MRVNIYFLTILLVLAYYFLTELDIRDIDRVSKSTIDGPGR